jgi:hypothetical protein
MLKAMLEKHFLCGFEYSLTAFGSFSLFAFCNAHRAL